MRERTPVQLRYESLIIEDCAYNLKRLKLQVRTSSVTPIKSVVVVSSEVKLQKLCWPCLHGDVFEAVSGTDLLNSHFILFLQTAARRRVHTERFHETGASPVFSVTFTQTEAGHHICSNAQITSGAPRTRARTQNETDCKEQLVSSRVF